MNNSIRGLRLVHAVLKACLVALSVAATASPAAAQFLYGTATAVDGDTIRMGDRTIRLFGIDAPEGRQTCAAAGGSEWSCGEAAATRLTSLLLLGPIACEGDELDDFGRLLAVCDAYYGTPINATLVAEGFAWAFVRYSADYIAEETVARTQGLGIWQAPTIPAWEYRALNAATFLTDQPAPPAGCTIKGNINREGERIYHLPGWPSYEATVIHVEDGERWFCSEAEATAAGWRAPLGMQ